MLNLVTSYGDTAGTSVVNQVLRQHNAFEQLQYEFQEHTGAVDPLASPKLEYDYEDGSGEHNPADIIAPPESSSYKTAFTYSSGDDDALDRPTTVGGSPKAAYQYFGLGSVATVDYTSGGTAIIACTLATGSKLPRLTTNSAA